MIFGCDYLGAVPGLALRPFSEAESTEAVTPAPCYPAVFNYGFLYVLVIMFFVSNVKVVDEIGQCLNHIFMSIMSS